MTAVAQSWLILQLTGNPFDLGLLTVAQFGPVLVLGLFGGLIADGLPKRRTLYVTQTVAMGVSFLLFVLAATHTVQVWHVFVLAAVMGVRNSVDMPTRQAFAVEMVGREDVGNAVALNSAMFNGARVLGPAIAGLAIGAFGVSIAFLIDAVSFLAVLLGLFLMNEQELRPAPRFDRPASVGEVFVEPGRRPALRPADRADPAGDHDRRRRGHVRDQLHDPDPAPRGGRAPRRGQRLRLPDGRLRPRLAAGRPGHRLRRDPGDPDADRRDRPGRRRDPDRRHLELSRSTWS